MAVELYAVTQNDREWWTGNGWSKSFDDAALVRSGARAMEIASDFLRRNPFRMYGAAKISLKPEVEMLNG